MLNVSKECVGYLGFVDNDLGWFRIALVGFKDQSKLDTFMDKVQAIAFTVSDGESKDHFVSRVDDEYHKLFTIERETNGDCRNIQDQSVLRDWLGQLYDSTVAGRI